MLHLVELFSLNIPDFHFFGVFLHIVFPLIQCHDDPLQPHHLVLYIILCMSIRIQLVPNQAEVFEYLFYLQLVIRFLNIIEIIVINIQLLHLLMHHLFLLMALIMVRIIIIVIIFLQVLPHVRIELGATRPVIVILLLMRVLEIQIPNLLYNVSNFINLLFSDRA